MINERSARDFCSEDISKVQNCDKAMSDKTQTWDIHHKLEMFMSRKELITIGRYYSIPARELVFLTRKEHWQWPHKGRIEAKQKMSDARRGKHHSTESKKKMSESNRGKHHSEEAKKKMSKSKRGENNPLFGKHHSMETKKKMSETNRCMKWWNNDKVQVFKAECPEGFVAGMLKRKRNLEKCSG